MAFCRNCGTELVENAKYCQKCGYPTKDEQNVSCKRTEVFVGEIHKCPNCGEVLKSFEINCPSCGYELRGVKATNAVKEFALKLEAIESKRSISKNKYFSSANSLQLISDTDEQKISLIKSFPIPNSKEDMLEFMLLAMSNLNLRVYASLNNEIKKSEKMLNDAWVSKIDQVYEKATLSYGSDEKLLEIKNLYDKCYYKINKAKKKGFIKAAIFYGWLPLLLVLEIIFLPPIARSANKKEEQRISTIVDEVEINLDNKEYKLALMNADSIEYKGSDDERERYWNIQKQHIIDMILEEADKNGVYLEYVPNIDIDNVNDEPMGETKETKTGNNEEFRFVSDETQKNIDEFNKQMEKIKQQWDSAWNNNEIEQSQENIGVSSN